jgi:hypothetical protein
LPSSIFCLAGKRKLAGAAAASADADCGHRSNPPAAPGSWQQPACPPQPPPGDAAAPGVPPNCPSQPGRLPLIRPSLGFVIFVNSLEDIWI